MNVTERERIAIAEDVKQARAAVMDEIARRLAEPARLGDGEFTTTMYAERHSLDGDVAYRALRRAAKLDLLESRIAIVNGRRENVWRFSDNGSHNENGGTK